MKKGEIIIENYDPQFKIEPKLDKKLSYTYLGVITLILLSAFANEVHYISTTEYSQLKGLFNMIHILATLFLILLIPFGGLLVLVNMRMNFKLKGKYIFLMRLLGAKKGIITKILAFPLIKLFFKNTIIGIIIINILYVLVYFIDTLGCINFFSLNFMLIFYYAVPFFIVMTLFTLSVPASMKVKQYL